MYSTRDNKEHNNRKHKKKEGKDVCSPQHAMAAPRVVMANHWVSLAYCDRGRQLA